MGYRSDVVIQIETTKRETIESIVNSFENLLMNRCAVYHTYYCTTNSNETIYVFVASMYSIKWYPSYPEIAEIEKWFEMYSDIAEVGENTYGVFSTQLQMLGEDEADNTYELHGEPYNYLSLVRKVEIEAEDKCLPLKL